MHSCLSEHIKQKDSQGSYHYTRLDWMGVASDEDLQRIEPLILTLPQRCSEHPSFPIIFGNHLHSQPLTRQTVSLLLQTPKKTRRITQHLSVQNTCAISRIFFSSLQYNYICFNAITTPVFCTLNSRQPKEETGFYFSWPCLSENNTMLQNNSGRTAYLYQKKRERR